MCTVLLLLLLLLFSGCASTWHPGLATELVASDHQQASMAVHYAGPSY
jgi:hypothetical protein